MTQDNTSPYLAYLVRLWCEDNQTWRGTLENPHTGERLAFATVDALLTHLKLQTTNSKLKEHTD